MEFFMDLSSWIGLITLVILEIVLGIDNLVFIAILANKLPNKKHRNQARLIGLSLALIMRLALLSVISWMVTLTNPLFSVANYTFSGRNIIMLLGGIFLLFKATTELNERLDYRDHSNRKKTYTKIWILVIQIVILDAICSLDAVITAVGMVNHIPVMMSAVIIAMIIMLIASKPITKFINQRPTVVVLCLSFLFMIGLSLVAEGFGFHIPKGYLYAAISFSSLIEIFNQISQFNFIKKKSKQIFHTTTENTIRRLISTRKTDIASDIDINHFQMFFTALEKRFLEDTYDIINRILSLESLSLQEIMTPRDKIHWIDINLNITEIRKKILLSPHNVFPICNGKLDKIIGVLHVKKMLLYLESEKNIITFDKTNYITADIVLETLDLINLISIFYKKNSHFVVVTNKFGVVKGLVTLWDVFKAIYKKFPNEQKDKVKFGLN